MIIVFKLIDFKLIDFELIDFKAIDFIGTPHGERTSIAQNGSSAKKLMITLSSRFCGLIFLNHGGSGHALRYAYEYG